MRRHAQLVLTLAATVLAARMTDAVASTSRAVPFDALVHDSTAAALVTPVSETSVWEGDRVVTYSDVHVDALVAGTNASVGEELWVRRLGGTVGHVGQSVEGEAVLTVGHPALLFIHPAVMLGAVTGSRPTLSGIYAVTGRAQGHFPVVTNAQGELHLQTSGGIGATVAPSGAVATTLLATDALHGTKVEDAKHLIAAAWSRVHAP